MTQDRKEYLKAYYQAHREQHKAYKKVWREAHKEEIQDANKAWYEANKEQQKEYKKSYMKAYQKADVNALGQMKERIRSKSRYYLNKYGTKIPGYQIHHCCTYTEPYKFVYCSKEIHRLIHAYLRQHNINADSNHYEYIKHLLDESVVLYGLER